MYKCDTGVAIEFCYDIFVHLHDLSQFYLEYALLKFLGFETSDSHRQLLETPQQL